MTIPVRVVIVEDHPIYREGLQTALSELPDIQVLATAGTATEATAHVDPAQTRPGAARPHAP